MSTAPDLELLKQWASRRDANAFRDIVSRYGPMVYGTCRRVLRDAVEAEDVTQECFEFLAKARNGPRRHLGGWLHTLATHRSLNRVKETHRRRERETRYAAARQTTTQIKWDDIYEFVDEAIAELPEEVRMPLIAHFLQGESHKSIAAATGVPRRTVSYRISRGVEQVGGLLKKRGVIVETAILSTLLSANLASAMSLPASLATSLGKLGLAHAAKSAPAATASRAAPMGVLGGTLTMKIGLILVAVAIVISGPWLLGVFSNDAPRDLRIAENRLEPAAPEDVRVSENTLERPTPEEIVAAYRDARNAQRHFIFQFSGSIDVDYQNWSPRGTNLPRFRTSYASGELASDGTRAVLRMKRWGQIGTANWAEEEADYRRNAFDGGEYWTYHIGRSPGTPDVYRHGVLIVDTDSEEPHREILTSAEPVRNLLGYTNWSSARAQIKDYLDNAEVLSVRPDNESLDGTDCVVIDFRSVLGKGTIWFAPEYGYNVAKADIVESPGDVRDLKKGTRWCEGCRSRFLFDDFSFEQVDGVWFPTSMTSHVELHRPDWKEVDIIQCEVSDIRLNPDLDALGVFSKADIEEGALAAYMGGGTTKYRWLGGKLVLVDSP